MSNEIFKADPKELAGLSKIVGEIGTDASNAGKFVGEQALPAQWLSGPIIDEMLSPARAMAEAIASRMESIGRVTTETGTELNKVAWLYSDQDRENYAALNQHTFLAPLGPNSPRGTDATTESYGVTEQYQSATNYPKPEGFKLDPPKVNKEDTVALIAEVAPVLGNVNESIKNITRTAGHEIDPLGTCLDPIPGNWNEVRRMGEAYKIAGLGLEACGKNLEDSLKRVDPHWNGKGAQSFNDWASHQVDAMKWEGPVGRVLGDTFGVVADQIRKTIKAILQKLWDILNDQIDFTSVRGIFKTIGRKIPVVGQAYEIVNLGIKISNIVDMAIHAVEKIRELVDKVKILIKYFTDPVAALKDKAQDKLNEAIEPFSDALAKGSKKVAVTADLAQIANIKSKTERPTDGYDIGSGQRPWEDG